MAKVIRREYLDKLIRFKDMTDLVKVITGIRRCGKSTLLIQFKDHLIAEGIDKKNIIYINFESSTAEELLDRKSLFKYLTDVDRDGRKYLLLDEIQRVKEWELMVNAILVDMDADIYITGSNAYFLSSGLSTYLTGRSVAIDMLPLSFKEFIELNAGSDIVDYLNVGGMPILRKTVNYEDSQDILNNINSTILLNDVVARNNIRDVQQLMRVMEYIYSEIGNLISSNSIAKHLGVNNKTVDSYLSMLEESLIVIKANRYDLMGKKILSGNSKYYATDTGMRNAYLRARDRDTGRLIENTVFLELKRRGYRVVIGKYGDLEVDFTADRNGVTEYFQISKTVSDQVVLEREMKPLEMIRDNYRKTIITFDRPIQKNINGIRFVTLEEFLLEITDTE